MKPGNEPKFKKWKKLFVSGNPEILEKLRTIHAAQDVSFTDDYNIVRNIDSSTDVWIVAIINDPRFPLRNTVKDVAPGEFLGDIFVRSGNEAYNRLCYNLYSYDLLETFLNGLVSEKYTVRFKNWTFYGGRNASEHWFDIFRYDEFVASIALSGDSIHYVTQDRNVSTDGILTRKNLVLVNAVETIILKALERDDREIVRACTDLSTGEWTLPCGYKDVYRDDLLKNYTHKNRSQSIKQ